MSNAVYPLIFTYTDTISGNGFLAGITVTGKAIITKEEDEKWWMYGVRPGGIADRGQTPNEAFKEFRERYKLALFDIATEAASFEAFRDQVEQFFYQPDDEEEHRWAEALESLRTGAVVPEAPFSELQRDTPESRPTSISVARLDKTNRFMATDNAIDVLVMPTQLQAA